MNDTVDRQLTAYLLVCCGMGAMFGAFGGVPGMFPGVFIAQLWFEGFALAALGLGWFYWEIR